MHQPSPHKLHPQIQANLQEAFAPGDMPDAIRMQMLLGDQVCVLKAHLDCWELDKAYAVLKQIKVGFSELNDMHQRRVGYDIGKNAGYRDGVAQSRQIETLIGTLVRSGATAVVIHGGGDHK